MNSLWSNFKALLSVGVAAFCVLMAAPHLAAAQDKTLRVRFYDDPAGFDPATVFRIENENIAFNIFSGLTTYDGETGKIIGDLAESWETPDNKTWTFHLRKGVKFQKGYGDLTAVDVIWSFEHYRDPATASPYATEFNGIESMEAPDDFTVLIKLKAPDGNFLHAVANYHQGQILKKAAVEAAGKQLRWQPVGTGPYYLDSIDVNSRIILKRNKDYFRGPAPIDTIIFQIIKDEQTANIALRKGEIDLVMRSNREENLAILEKEGFKLNKVENYAVALQVANMKNKALSDKRVRQALAYGVDWEAIIKATGPTLQAPAHSMLMPWMDVYTPDVKRYPFNPTLAKQLLKDAGYPNGFTVKYLGTSAQGVTDFQQFEIDYLSQIGVKMEMELVDTPTFNQRRNNGDFDLTTRLLPAVNPDMILFSFLDPANMAPKGLNGAHYDNPALTKLLYAAKAETDQAKRKAMYAEVQQMAMEDMPYLPTYTNNVVWPGKKNVTGVRINYLAQVNLYDVDIK